MDSKTSPDGTLRVDFNDIEMRMSLWVERPILTHVPSGRVLLNLDQTDWDGSEMHFEETGCLHMCLRKYPGDRPSFDVHIDTVGGTFAWSDQAGERYPLKTLRSKIEDRYRRTPPRVPQADPVPEWTWAQVGALLLFLSLAVLLWWVIAYIRHPPSG